MDEPIWTNLGSLNALVVPSIKFKRIMAETSGSGDMTEKVTYMPTLPGEKTLFFLKRHTQTQSGLMAN